jgi:hypothetical protein
MTPLCKSEQCQWLRCDMHSGVNDYAEIFSKFAYLYSGVYNSAVLVTAVSMTPLCMSQQCQWLRCARHSGVNHSAVQVTAKSDFWWVFFKLWIHKIWEVSLWFVLIGFTPRICYINGGLSPRLNTGFGILRFVLICDSTVHVTVVSMTLLCMSQWCQWLRWTLSKFASRHSSVNDSAVHFTAVSMTPLYTTQGCPWLRFAHHSGVNDSTVQVTGVWMTPLCNKLFRFSRRILRHIEKGFIPCIRGIGGVVWWRKKKMSKISCQDPFNSLYRAKK